MRTKIVTQERADAEAAKRPIISRKYTTPEARLEWWAKKVKSCLDARIRHYHALPKHLRKYADNRKPWRDLDPETKERIKAKMAMRRQTEQYKEWERAYRAKNADTLKAKAHERYLKRKAAAKREGFVDRRIKYATEEERIAGYKEKARQGSIRQRERIRAAKATQPQVPRKKPGRKPKYATEKERKEALRRMKRESYQRAKVKKKNTEN